jgi:hypothetical protein
MKGKRGIIVVLAVSIVAGVLLNALFGPIIALIGGTVIGFVLFRRPRRASSKGFERFTPGSVYSSDEIHERYYSIRKKYDQETFKRFNREQFMFKDQENTFWGIGARTGRWVRYEAEKGKGKGEWVEADPPRHLKSMINTPDPASPHPRQDKQFCSACGSELSFGSKFCVKCGTKQA